MDSSVIYRHSYSMVILCICRSIMRLYVVVFFTFCCCLLFDLEDFRMKMCPYNMLLIFLFVLNNSFYVQTTFIEMALDHDQQTCNIN